MDGIRSVFHGGTPQELSPREITKQAKKDIGAVVGRSLENLQAEIAKTHAGILQGTETDVGHSIKQMEGKIKEAKGKLESLKSQYAAHDSAKVQDLLVKGELQVAQLEQAVANLQIFGTEQGKKVLEAKTVINKLLTEQDISNLAVAQERLNLVKKEVKAEKDSPLDRELQVLQKRICHQAIRQTALDKKEKKLLDAFQQDNQVLIDKKNKNAERYESLLTKLYTLRFCTGIKHESFTTAQALATHFTSNKHIQSLKDYQPEVNPKTFENDVKKTSTSALAKTMDRLAKTCLKTLRGIRESSDDLVQNPSDKSREAIEKNLHKTIDASISELNKCDDRLAILAAKGKHRKQVHKLHVKRTEILASLSAMQANRTVLRGNAIVNLHGEDLERAREIQKTILALEQHKVVQEIFSSLRHVAKDTGVQVDAGDKVEQARQALDAIVTHKGKEYSLVGTLQREFAQIAADALASKSGSKKLLNGARNITSTDQRAYKRFANVLSMQVQAYEFATGDVKLKIEANIARLKEAVDTNPNLRVSKEIQDLLASFDRLRTPPKPAPAVVGPPPKPAPAVVGPPPRPPQSVVRPGVPPRQGAPQPRPAAPPRAGQRPLPPPRGGGQGPIKA